MKGNPPHPSEQHQGIALILESISGPAAGRTAVAGIVRTGNWYCADVSPRQRRCQLRQRQNQLGKQSPCALEMDCYCGRCPGMCQKLDGRSARAMRMRSGADSSAAMVADLPAADPAFRVLEGASNPRLQGWKGLQLRENSSPGQALHHEVCNQEARHRMSCPWMHDARQKRSRAFRTPLLNALNVLAC